MTPTPQAFGHPRGLAYLFTTEIWERFAYYGMRALLILYMTDVLFTPERIDAIAFLPELRAGLEHIYGTLSSQALSSQIYGLYTALVYLTPLAGGALADRYLGQRRSVFIGAILMAAGEFTLAASEALFLPGLLLVILGNGAFKPNISAQVGALYAPGDHRRDRAFSIFYAGVNLGSALAPLVCGTIGEIYGWRYGFTAAGVGMILGMFIFAAARPFLAPEQKRADIERAPLTASERSVMRGLMFLALVSIFFWAAFEQKGNTMVLWLRDNTDRSFFGWFDLRVTWFQSTNAILIVTLTPLVVRLWRWLDERGREPSTGTKMAVGCMLAAIAYLVMALAAASSGAQASWGWAILYVALLTCGELCLAPVGLSLVSQLAPRAYLSFMIGVWLLGHFFGNYVAGFLGQFWSSMPKEQFWLMIASVPAVAAICTSAAQRALETTLRAR